jgi:hypothetical protein
MGNSFSDLEDLLIPFLDREDEALKGSRITSAFADHPTGTQRESNKSRHMG